MPGRANRSRNATTSGVISPRSSARNGSLPNAAFAVVKKSAPGPTTQRPRLAVADPAGTCQAAAKARK